MCGYSFGFKSTHVSVRPGYLQAHLLHDFKRHHVCTNTCIQHAIVEIFIVHHKSHEERRIFTVMDLKCSACNIIGGSIGSVVPEKKVLKRSLMEGF
jgi:hypothetical protein